MVKIIKYGFKMNRNIGDLIVALSEFCEKQEISFLEFSQIILDTLTIQLSSGLRILRPSQDLKKLATYLVERDNALKPLSRADVLEILLFTKYDNKLSQKMFGLEGRKFSHNLKNKNIEGK